MHSKKLGNSDLTVSSYCLGTMTFGETTEESIAHKQISECFEKGINFIDTAEMYPTCPIKKKTTGKTEEIVGNWIKKNRVKRKSIILATKIVGKGFTLIRDGGPINKSSIKKAVDGSLKRLKTDYIDLYQLHWPNRGSYHFRTYWDYRPTKINISKFDDEYEEIIYTLNELKKNGIIRAIGLSNDTCWGVMKFLDKLKDYKNLSLASIQNEYSLMCRLFDYDFNELALNENIPLLAYSPLARGLLTGKYLNGNIPKGSRLSRDEKIKKIRNEKSDLAVKDYCDLAKNFSIDPVHMALAFCNQRPFMGSVIFGATDMTQLERILKGLELKLNNEILECIKVLHKKHPLTF